MVFSETIFLFGFLPLTLLGYALCPRRLKNLWLLVTSLAFYAFGERLYSLLMLATIALNFVAGRRLGQLPQGSAASRRVLGWAVASDLALLAGFKYANFVVDNANGLLGLAGLPLLSLPPVHLPIGVSFFTFQAVSYVIDVYREPRLAQQSPLKLGVYIAMFPQLIAGPIVRYGQVSAALDQRRFAMQQALSGVACFTVGLGKKVILADSFAVYADAIFALPAKDLALDVAWFGTVSYALQIYFDFSGYSDMAVGLGRLLGFEFPQNFRYPYVSASATDFWRRWHISLSTWFRDYLYIPLGGNRVSPARTYVNLWVVFLLCGLWHGAAWTFVLWGAWHGGLLVVERAGLSKVLDGRPWLGVPYTLLAVLCGWVLFRAESLPRAVLHLTAMAGLSSAGPQFGNLGYYLDPWCVVVLPVAMVSATPLWRTVLARLAHLRHGEEAAAWLGRALLLGRATAVACILFASLVMVSAGSYSPFIYFRF